MNKKNVTLGILAFLALLLSPAHRLFAQEITTPPKTYHNEFGIDVTSFVKEFLNINQNSQDYIPTYYLTYRRNFKCGNLRFGIGANYSSQDIPPAFVGDHKQYHSNAHSIDLRIGWEFVTDLSKSWQVFYGVDFRPSFIYNKNDAPYWNAGYANGQEVKSQNMGVAALLGFRFRLNDRLSLRTETNFSFNWLQNSGRNYFIPVSSQYPAIPDVDIPKTKSSFSHFTPPVSLMLSFKI